MSDIYRINLIQKVLDESESNMWDDAVQEWVIEDCEEDNELQSSCICGKENLRYLFRIRNNINGNTLFPIGSSCIRKFDREDLNEEVNVKEKIFKLFHAIEDGSFITLSSEFFSRNLLKYLYNEGAFQANEYNDYNPEIDYKFMLKMFNKRDKDSITENQKKKINAIIIVSIRPYLVVKLKNKIL